MSSLAPFSRCIKDWISVSFRKNVETTNDPVSVPPAIPNHFNKETFGHHDETRLQETIYCFISPIFCVDRAEDFYDSMQPAYNRRKRRRETVLI